MHVAAALAGLVALAFLAATFRLGFEKGLVDTIAPAEWGRYLFGISSAITELNFGVGRFASSIYVESTLRYSGLTDQPDVLQQLGFKFPDNLRDPLLMQSALDKAWAMPHPPIDKPDDRGYYEVLRGAMGDDVGLSTYAMLGFQLFGRHISSLYYT